MSSERVKYAQFTSFVQRVGVYTSFMTVVSKKTLARRLENGVNVRVI